MKKQITQNYKYDWGCKEMEDGYQINLWLVLFAIFFLFTCTVVGFLFITYNFGLLIYQFIA